MTRPTPLAKPRCMPTPLIDEPQAGRWIKLPFCRAKFLTLNMALNLQSLSRKPKPGGPSITVEQCRALIQLIEEQLPDEAPDLCCTLMDLRFTAHQLYDLNGWRYWLETELADTISRLNTSTIGGQILAGKIEQMYAKLGEIKKALAPPIKTG